MKNFCEWPLTLLLVTALGCTTEDSSDESSVKTNNENCVWNCSDNLDSANQSTEGLLTQAADYANKRIISGGEDGKDAIHTLEKIFDIDPENTKARDLLYEIFNNNQSDDAAYQLDLKIRRMDFSFGVAKQKARVGYYDSDTTDIGESALEILNELLQSYPNHQSALNLRSKILRILEDSSNGSESQND